MGRACHSIQSSGRIVKTIMQGSGFLFLEEGLTRLSTDAKESECV